MTTSFNNINDKLFTGLVFLDLDKAFDSVSHDILSAKLGHYGIKRLTNSLLHSFLKKKTIRIPINGSNSDTLSNNYGVAQGSIL